MCRVRASLCHFTTLSYLTLETFSSIWMRKLFVPYLLLWIGLLKTVCSTENFERAHVAVNGHGHAKTENERQRGNGNQHHCILRRLLRFVSFQLFTFCEHEHRSNCLVTTITDNETILDAMYFVLVPSEWRHVKGEIFQLELAARKIHRRTPWARNVIISCGISKDVKMFSIKSN